MAVVNEIKIPDIGGAAGVDVIELLVKEGDDIKVDTPLLTLESDKASMEIPSPRAGRVKSLALKVGDKVSEGDVILTLEADELTEVTQVKEQSDEPRSAATVHTDVVKDGTTDSEVEVKVPDIGGAASVDVIEVLVKEGDEIDVDSSLITLESDKASMDIPSPYKGVVQSVRLNVGDKVSQGDTILTVRTKANVAASTPIESPKPQAVQQDEPVHSKTVALLKEEKETQGVIHAGPAARRLARTLGVDLEKIHGSGRKSRVSKEDIEQYVKAKLNETNKGGIAVSKAPDIDFTKFGTVSVQPLNKIKRLTGENVHRSWITIPHVTQFDEADITQLEAFRKQESHTQGDNGVKITILAFVCKVVSKALEVFPQFNASLDSKGENLIYKQYYNVGIAVETPNGLVVPVIKEVNRLSVKDIAQEMARLSRKAREKGLMPTDMSGGCFTISSLGGIGGTAFTPIVNSPEVAILGLSRSSYKPIFIDGEFVPRLMLPLSLSYDHRVIDGAEAARFTRYLSDALSDIRRILL